MMSCLVHATDASTQSDRHTIVTLPWPRLSVCFEKPWVINITGDKHPTSDPCRTPSPRLKKHPFIIMGWDWSGKQPSVPSASLSADLYLPQWRHLTNPEPWVGWVMAWSAHVLTTKWCDTHTRTKGKYLKGLSTEQPRKTFRWTG